MTSLLTLVTSQQPPPNYSYDALPETSFSCEGRVVGGYYADVEAGCQMFHVCGTSQRTSFRFLCPNNTVFDQQHLICANWFQVSCDRSTVLYARNFEIFKKGSENEVEFNALDEEDLPELEDYDSGFQGTSSGAGRFFGGGGGSRRVTAAPVTRQPASRAPRRFDLSTAATTPHPAAATDSVSFRDQSTFATASTAPAQRAPSRRPLLPTPLPPLAPAPAETSRVPPAPAPTSTPTSAPVGQDVARVTLGEFRATSPRPVPTFTTPAPPLPTAAPAAAGGSFSTPVPVFTTTGRFPFGFTSVPRTNFAFGRGGSFSFGTGVSSRAPVAPTAGSPTTAVTAPPELPELTNDLREQELNSGDSRRQFGGTDRRTGVSVSSTPRSFTARTLPPTTPAPFRVVSVSPASPFVRGTPLPTTRPSQAPTESARTVSPAAGSFFGASVVPNVASTSGRATFGGRGQTRQNVDSSESFGDVNDINDINDINTRVKDESSGNGIGRGRLEVTTAPPGGRFSATVPTRSPSTRFSGGRAPSTAQPSGGARASFRRRRPSAATTAAPASEGAIVSRRRGSRWRGGSRVRPSAEPVTGVSPAAAVAPSVSPSAAAPSAAVGVLSPSRRPAVARPVPRPTTTPPAELTNEIDSAPTRKPTPRSRSRGRGSRRFDPRLPGGDLSPTQYVRTRGGRGRLAPPTVPPPTLPPQLSSISDIADVEALTDQLNLLDEQELLEELEREDRRFRNGPEANNRSIDSSSRRQKLPDRGTTPAPLLIARGPPPTRPAPRRPTAAPTTAAAVTTPQIIRKRIRVRGRPSRRPRVGGRRRTTTTRRPTTTTTTTETPTTAAPPPRTRPAVTVPPTVPPAPTTTPAPTTEVSTLPTNKEASNIGRQSGGFFLRPKLQLSSALPTDLQTRRLNDVNELAAERTGRSRNTSPIAFSRGTRSTTRAPEARLSEILFASSSPGRAGGGRTGDADYDYQYYDSDFRLEHQDDIEDVDDLFQTLSRKSRWT
ncbi:mucin-5AC-like [Amphibalanus amphitrite]|uniref:mucin-5AC-like n=1 Tax=Amphibalanus amphitrite TaxID=1232801 RepID=UPI001C8FBFD5|nr:mucin-5AC-like [Amphibalanus amphitrite]